VSAPTSNSMSGCTEFFTCFWSLKLLVWPHLVMPNTLLEFSMVFLPQESLIWHRLFMFFLPPLPPSFTPLLFPKLLSLHFPIVLHPYTFATFLFTPSPSPNCVTTPASLSSFLLFYGYPLATITISHYLISNYCFPPSSPWIAQPISLSLPTLPNPPFSLFHHFMDQMYYYGLAVPQ
jgi:hypothetical protein